MRSLLSKGLGAGCAIAAIASGWVLSCNTARASAPSATNSAALKEEIPQSVFVIPSSPKEGRNPFFPASVVTAAPMPTPSKGGATAEAAAFVLNGITSPPKRTAIINNRTFEAGEEGEVRLSSGTKVLIKCAEIKDDSAIIVVSGQRRELHFRGNL